MKTLSENVFFDLIIVSNSNSNSLQSHDSKFTVEIFLISFEKNDDFNFFFIIK